MEDLTKLEIKEFDILLVHRLPYNLSPESWLLAPGIRYFTDCYYNHVDTVVNVSGELWVCGAVASGFVPHTPLDMWLNEVGHKRHFALLKNKQHDEDLFQERFHEIAGAKYDWNATLGDGFLDAIKSKFFGKEHNWNKKRANQSKVNCSEAIAYINGMVDSYKVTPKNILGSHKFSVIFESNPLHR